MQKKKEPSEADFGSNWDILKAANDGSAAQCVEAMLIAMSYVAVAVTMPFSLFFVCKIVNQYEKAVIFRLGRLRKGTKGPGIFFVLPCVDIYVKVDMRMVALDIPSQDVLTKDSCTVSVTAVVYYLVENPLKAVVGIENFKYATVLLAASTLRNIVGQKCLSEILTERKAIAKKLGESLEHAVIRWGIKIVNVEIKDVSLPQEMQRAMAAEAEAYRDAKAKVISAEGELESAKNLKEAANIIAENPLTMQLRYLQTLQQVASDKNTTIAFPLPRAFLKRNFL